MEHLRGGIFLVVFMLCFTAIFFKLVDSHKEPPVVEKKKVVKVKPDTILNKANLIKEIAKYPFHDRELVLKSAIIECGHGLNSYNATHRHNLFGMKKSSRRYPSQGGYTFYPNWQESVKDRYIHEALWFKTGSYESYLNRN